MRVSIQYSDLVLLGILCSLLLGAVVGYATPVPAPIAVPAAAAGGVALIYHTLFMRGPVGGREELSEEVREVELLE